ncbi:hypothetical protein A5677_16970 [Mycobacterium malmoense]|uniref:Uncharacterized protein n=1 Tax=Mycobacterium malmoense TaxID=1780 RepID=A0A1B9DA93_MYCMA|nr:hypothetical protein [Mycobacterium malmoense]OCB57656.1 hypothetical protein A5677_16970 [Mycobacterium malmoense]
MSARTTNVAYSLSYAGFKWHLYDSHDNHLDSFEGSSSDAVHAAMSVVIARGDFGKGDWFAAGRGEYEFRLT